MIPEVTYLGAFCVCCVLATSSDPGYWWWHRNFNPDYPDGLFCRTNQVHQVLKFPKLSLVWNICYSQQDLLLRWCFFLAESIGKWNSWKKIDLNGYYHTSQINSTETSHGQFWLQGFECIRDASASRRAEGWKTLGHGGNLLDPLPCFFPNKACHVVHLNSILAKTYDKSNTNNHNHVIRHHQKHKNLTTAT